MLPVLPYEHAANASPPTQLIYYTTPAPVCQGLFANIFPHPGIFLPRFGAPPPPRRRKRGKARQIQGVAKHPDARQSDVWQSEAQQAQRRQPGARHPKAQQFKAWQPEARRNALSAFPVRFLTNSGAAHMLYGGLSRGNRSGRPPRRIRKETQYGNCSIQQNRQRHADCLRRKLSGHACPDRRARYPLQSG